MEPAISAKTSERRRLRAIRRAFHARNPFAEKEIGRLVFQWLQARLDIRVVGAYCAIHSEPDILDGIGQWMHAAPGRAAGLPVISGGKMSYVKWMPGEEMEPDQFGVPVPCDRIPVSPEVIFAPCVGFAASGLRLGYGGGWYDRFLASAGTRLQTVAVSYACCLSDGLRQQDHDILFDWIITEKGCVKASAGG